MESLQCENCGNVYDNAFTVTLKGQTHIFDCFECAINAVAPLCVHCGTRIIGHGVEDKGSIYCCNNCARNEGVSELRSVAEV